MSQPLLMVYFTADSVKYAFATKTFVTTDTINGMAAGTLVEGRLQQPGLMRRDMYGQGAVRGEVPISTGAIQLANTDGELDALRDVPMDGVLFVLATVVNGDVSKIIRAGYLEQAVAESEDFITLPVRDVQHAMDKLDLMEDRYAGTNALPAGIEGTAADIKGRVKPLVVGKVFNVSPVCVNTSRLIYQVDGQRGFVTGWSLTVYDKRSTLTAGANYTSQADMETNAPAAGQYRVWPSGGCFRLGSSPTGQVTADCTNPPTASAACTVSNVLKYFADPLFTFTPDYTSDPEVGIYLTESTSWLAAFNEVAASVQAFLTQGWAPWVGAGLQWGGWSSHLMPAASLPYTPVSVDLTVSNIVPGSMRQVLPGDATRGLPVWRVNVHYKKNYTVMSPADLAGVALADQAFCEQAFRTVSKSQTSVLIDYPDALELDIPTLLVDATEAETEAQRLLDLFKVKRNVFSLKVQMEDIRIQLGSSIDFFSIGVAATLTYPRHGFDAGVDMVIIGAEENFAEDTVDLIVWG
ncbi:MAG TPA: hypothetical protein VGE22_12360 [Solimonas sp.]